MHFGKRRRRRRFGEGEESLEVKGEKANIFKRIGGGIKHKAVAVGHYAKAHPKKFTAMVLGGVALAGVAAVAIPAMAGAGAVAGTAVVAGETAVVAGGAATTSAATGLSTATTGLGMFGKLKHALGGAKKAGDTAKVVSTLAEQERTLAHTAEALNESKSSLSTALNATKKGLGALSDGVSSLQQVKTTVDTARALVPQGAQKDVQEGVRAIGEITEKVPEPGASTAFGKRRRRRHSRKTRFGNCGCGKTYQQFGNKFGNTSEIGKQQVMNFGMTKKKAIEIIRKVYRKNCKERLKK